MSGGLWVSFHEWIVQIETKLILPTEAPDCLEGSSQ